MIFKFPRKKIVVDCFTYDQNIITTAPIVPAMKLIPDWWKTLPQSNVEKNKFYPSATMKNCVGMVDYYKKSFVIPLWSEMALSINPNQNYSWQFADRVTEAEVHDLRAQALGFLNNFGHLKVITPWHISTKENISWVWSQPTYSFPDEQELIILPAIIEYFYQNASSINMLFSLDKPRIITVPLGQPMVHLTPMTEKKVEIARHLITKIEYIRKQTSKLPTSFIKGYATRVKRIKQFSDCPFQNHIEDIRKAQEK